MADKLQPLPRTGSDKEIGGWRRSLRDLINRAAHKVVGGTVGNLASLDSSGDLADSGIARFINAVGFKLSGGTSSKSLTVEDDSIIDQDLSQDADAILNSLSLADVLHLIDNKNVYFGTADDAGIKYDGTNLIINPALVGSGKVLLRGETVPEKRLYLPMGEVSYFDTTGTAITISAQSNGLTNMVVVNPTTALSSGGYEFDNGGANNGRLRYTGTVTKMFHIACSLSFSPATSNDTFVIAFAKNGTVYQPSRVMKKITTSGDTKSTAIHGMVELAQNDYLEIYVGNLTDTDNFVVKTMTIVAVGM